MKKLLLFALFFLLAENLFPQTSLQEIKPLIGISCSHPENNFSSARRTYTESVLKAGGLPILVPIIETEEDLARIISMLDGLILIGGEDVHPSYYNEEPIEELGDVNDIRDVYDLALIRLAADRKLPTFGICRGEQLINVAFGGSLYQDIPSQYEDTSVEHNQKVPSKYPTHYIDLLPGSIIATVTGETELVTNSHHHQAVKDVAPGFRVTAWSCDGIPEAIESSTGLPVWGVQFHPEAHTINGDSIMIRFFEFMTGQAVLYRNQK
ncbi:gamma-glutamyl-gamma-aminobutyrate hydrolase family protein [Bacteroides sp. 51]|uniref:gamma-glutamyl-gamma-aminobutyrate hydrolase family protein n=1 Tax=Bacteroides sp. 51 TaxID=2302938 RepID=UPI0013D4C260|nr:gamma-glutamyl-gamma-aminobutyrate hydrolase family protein [Bacteroides sp. 51]NDV81169.1 gamma-glutamyl-gamma-aminobutyrate hydrolase family protein [Bacteroides sp. 51]